ncbi:siderophore-interacting protein, partial [Nonomuraea dietziae]|uniref:siderophore-interacting protein n=1 Tax=Nonomuraea dietziae TaxID=65515 RepID=UPI0034295E2A
AARPGNELYLLGPGGGYAPSPDADWHLLAGDESALPAIAASLEALPSGATARVFIEVEGPEEEQKLDVPVVYVHRQGGPRGDRLVEAVRGLDFPSGRVHAFVHGEAACVKELRRFLRVEKEIPLDQLSISGYWRLGVDDEGWRSVKKDWNRQVEAEESAALTA